MPAPLLTESGAMAPLLVHPSVRPHPLVAVFLGTDHHPFDRVLTWSGDLAAADHHRWFVQHGYTDLPPTLDGAPILTARLLGELLRRADAVVTHAGPGMIMEARRAGHQPIVVARESGRGEHVDDHQVRFAEHVAGSGLITLVRHRVELETALAQTLRRGRRAAASPERSSEVAARFGDLVDRLPLRRAS